MDGPRGLGLAAEDQSVDVLADDGELQVADHTEGDVDTWDEVAPSVFEQPVGFVHSVGRLEFESLVQNLLLLCLLSVKQSKTHNKQHVESERRKEVCVVPILAHIRQLKHPQPQHLSHRISHILQSVSCHQVVWHSLLINTVFLWQNRVANPFSLIQLFLIESQQ